VTTEQALSAGACETADCAIGGHQVLRHAQLGVGGSAEIDGDAIPLHVTLWDGNASKGIILSGTGAGPS
jgi:hypothetical protein